MPRTFTLSALALATLCLFAGTAFTADKPAEKEVDIVGKYACKGTNPNGEAYEGTVKISKSGNTIIVEWAIGTDQRDGVGIRNGDSLAVGWKSAAESGVIVYKIEGKDGVKLVGKWSNNPGDGKQHDETLTKEK